MDEQHTLNVQELQEQIKQLQNAEKEHVGESLPAESVGTAIPMKYWIGEKSVRTYKIFKGALSPKKTKKLIKKLMKQGYPVDSWVRKTPKGGYGRY